MSKDKINIPDGIEEDRVDRFDAPVPGSSLTGTVGGSPNEQPPQFVDPDEAMNLIADKITSPRQSVRLIAMMKEGMTIEAAARTILSQGFSQGKWSVDMSLALLQPTFQMVSAVANRAMLEGDIREDQIIVMNPDVEQAEFMGQFVEAEGSVTTEPQEEVVDTSDLGFVSEGEI